MSEKTGFQMVPEGTKFALVFLHAWLAKSVKKYLKELNAKAFTFCDQIKFFFLSLKAFN